MTSIDMHCAIAERPGSPPPAKSAISIRALGAMARGSAGGSAGAQRARPTNRGRRGGTAREPPREGKKKKTRQIRPSTFSQRRGSAVPARFCAPPLRAAPRGSLAAGAGPLRAPTLPRAPRRWRRSAAPRAGSAGAERGRASAGLQRPLARGGAAVTQRGAAPRGRNGHGRAAPARGARPPPPQRSRGAMEAGHPQTGGVSKVFFRGRDKQKLFS